MNRNPKSPSPGQASKEHYWVKQSSMRYRRLEPGWFFLLLLATLKHSCKYFCYANMVSNIARSPLLGEIIDLTTRRHSLALKRFSLGGSAPAFSCSALRSRRTGINALISTSSNKLQRMQQSDMVRHHGDHDLNQWRGRRRRGAMHSSQRKKRLVDMALPLVATSDDESAPAITQYTIDDSVCEPTDPETLRKIVKKHINTLPRYWKSKPIAKHTADAFEIALDFVVQYGEMAGDSPTKVILDSGCGTGRSSFLLGERYPDCVVIGIDQSLARLSRNKSYNPHVSKNCTQKEGSNVLLLRAELSDFWRCMLSSSQWQHHAYVHRHYVLYPNPYPKKSRLKNRFYAHPCFPLLMMTLGMDKDHGQQKKMIIRSNWKRYLEEFLLAVNIWQETSGDFIDFREMIKDADGYDEWHPGVSSAEWETVGPERLETVSPLTNFEAKYLQCGEPVYELSVLKTQ